MDIKNIPVKDLIPYEKNTKKHDDVQINNVAESIKQYGFVQPIVIDKNNVVVIGHCRLLAAKKLKMEDVPCVCVDDLTEEQVKALRIVDNKSNESTWDFDFLADELAEINLDAFNFDFDVNFFAGANVVAQQIDFVFAAVAHCAVDGVAEPECGVGRLEEDCAFAFFRSVDVEFDSVVVADFFNREFLSCFDISDFGFETTSELAAAQTAVSSLLFTYKMGHKQFLDSLH